MSAMPWATYAGGLSPTQATRQRLQERAVGEAAARHIEKGGREIEEKDASGGR